MEPEETLRQIAGFARSLGIVRVCDVTRLDRIGLPVFAAIRPDAAPGSLCVHAGKGTRLIDAQVGATMEAIEFAVCERPRAPVDVHWAAPSDVMQTPHDFDLVDLCPVFGTVIPRHVPMAWTDAHDVATNHPCLVPYELVGFPLRTDLVPPSYFGATTNGLASGNSQLEATIHGLLEVMERHIESFRLIFDMSMLVDPDSLPHTLGNLLTTIRDAQLDVFLRCAPNAFGIPYFACFVTEDSPSSTVYATEGFGCHPSPEIAAVRAITEAIQSRLSFIHGGRDDIVDRYDLVASKPLADVIAFNTTLRNRVSTSRAIVSFASLQNPMADAASLEQLLDSLLDLLRQHGFPTVLRVPLTSPTDPCAVVRIIVPGMESLNAVTHRCGRRLASYAAATHGQPH